MSLNCNLHQYSNRFTNFQESLLKYLAIVVGIIGILACLSVLYTIILSRQYQLNHTNSMILFLTFCDLMLTISSIGAYTLTNSCDNTSLCVYTAIGTQFFSLSSFLWIAAICHSTYQSIANFFINESRELVNTFSIGGSNHSFNNKRKKNKEYNKLVHYHIICWIIPLISIIIILSTRSYGFTAHTCWVVSKSSSHDQSQLPLAAAVILFIIPLILIEIYIIYIFQFLLKTLKQIPYAQNLLEKYVRNLSIVIGSKAIFIIYRCILLFMPNNHTFSIVVFITLTCPLQGIGDYLILKEGVIFRSQDSTHSNYSNDHLTVHSSNGLLRSNDRDNNNESSSNPIISSKPIISKGYDLVDEEELVEIEFHDLNKLSNIEENTITI